MCTTKGGTNDEENAAVREQGTGGAGRRSDPGDAVVQRRNREGTDAAEDEQKRIREDLLPAEHRSAERRETGH